MTENELNEVYSFLIGQGLRTAHYMVGHDMDIRVLIREGKNISADSYYRDNRINVEIKNGKILKIISIG